jgi:hypothetical protein
MGRRANVSGAFLDRLSQGKGRVIITASDANQVSVEKNELKNGVFTYYLLEGLREKADMDGDGFVTVDEVYRYVCMMVPKATGQDQHPVKIGNRGSDILQNFCQSAEIGTMSAHSTAGEKLAARLRDLGF